MDFCATFPWLICLGAALLGGIIGWLLRRGGILRLRESLDLKTNNYNLLQTQFNDQNTAYTGLQTQFGELESKEASAQESLGIWRKRHADLDSSFDVYKTEKTTELETLKSDHDAKYSALSKEHEAGLSKQAEIQSSLDNEKKAKEEALGKAKGFETDLGNWRTKFSDLEKSSADKYASLESGHASKLSEVESGWNSKYASLQETHDASKVELDQLKGKFAGQENTIASLENDLSQAKNESAVLKQDWDTKYTALQREKDEEVNGLKSNLSSVQGEVNSAKQSSADWEKKHNDLKARLDGMENEQKSKLSALSNEKAGLASSLADMESKWKAAQQKADRSNALQSELDKFKLANSGFEDEISGLRRENKTVGAANTKLSGDLHKMRADLDASRGENRTLTTASSELNAKIRKSDAEIKRLEALLAKRPKETTVSKAKPAPKAKGKEATLARIKAKSKTIDFGRIGVAKASAKDDLKRIKGIGPFCETKLNALGIYRFEQIAKFNSKDEDKVNEAIEFFPGRVKRDEWVRQAKGLASGKSVSSAEVKKVVKKTPAMKSSGKVDTKAETLARIKAKTSKIDYARIGKASKGAKDDLQRIKGIGPFLEKKLHALDIYTFEQISKFNAKDEDIVNDAIEFFPGRIKRDLWSKQAKELFRAKKK